MAAVEPFYRAGGTEQLDADLITDDSFEHTDSREYGVWPGGSPSNKLDYSFGPLAKECGNSYFHMAKNIVMNHVYFWIPWFLDIIVAPFMGVVFYCAMKGAKLADPCFDRVFTGKLVDQGALNSKYGGAGDPYAAIPPR